MPNVSASSRRIVGALAVLLVSGFAIFRGISQERTSSDEAMWITSSQKAWSLFASGDWDSPHWSDIDSSWGYVNPPVAKYLLGFALSRQGVSWDRRGLEPPPLDVLVAARRSSAVMGVVGCLALFGIGVQLTTLRAAVIAAMLLGVSPFWLSVSRTVLTDVYAATLALLAVCVFLPVLRETRQARRWRVLVPCVVASGALAGLAVGSKLNAAPTAVFLGALFVVALGRAVTDAPAGRTRGAIQLVGLGLIFGAVSVAVFVGLNPYLHEDAWSRLSGILDFWRTMSEQRARVSAGGGFGKAFFPEEKGLEILLGKLVFPVRSASLLLVLPFAATAATRRFGPELARLGGWLLLIPASAVAAAARNPLMHPWIAWVGVLGCGVALVASAFAPSGRGERRIAPGFGPVLPVWSVLVAFFVWKEMHLPQSRYYLPLVPPLLLAAGYGLDVLGEDLARRGGTWAKRLAEVALVAGLLAVLASAPDHRRALPGTILTDAPQVVRALQGLCVAALLLGVGAALAGGRRSRSAASS